MIKKRNRSTKVLKVVSKKISVGLNSLTAASFQLTSLSQALTSPFSGMIVSSFVGLTLCDGCLRLFLNVLASKSDSMSFLVIIEIFEKSGSLSGGYGKGCFFVIFETFETLFVAV